MLMFANTVANGIAQQFPAKFKRMPRAPSRTELTFLLGPTAAIEAAPSKKAQCLRPFFCANKGLLDVFFRFFLGISLGLTRVGSHALASRGGAPQPGHRKPIVNAADARYSRATHSAKGAPSHGRACKLR